MTAYLLTWVGYGTLLVACAAGLFLNLLGLPGLWLIVVAAIVYAWLTGFAYLGLWAVAALVLLGLLAELVEFLAGAAGSKQAGGSKRGMAGAIVGGLIGGIAGTFIPIPVVGTVIGSVAGCFIGAYGIEKLIGRPHGQSFAIGYGAAKGRVWGLVFKTLFGCAMAVIAALAGLPVGWFQRSLPAPQPAVQTTQPVA